MSISYTTFFFFFFFVSLLFIVQDVDMLQLNLTHNDRIIASCVTPFGKRKVTKSLKRSPIVTSQIVVPNLKKSNKNQRYILGESFNVYIYILGCEYNIFSYVNYYILYCFRNLDWLMR